MIAKAVGWGAPGTNPVNAGDVAGGVAAGAGDAAGAGGVASAADVAGTAGVLSWALRHDSGGRGMGAGQ